MNQLSIIIPSKDVTNLKACMKAIRDCQEACRIIVIDDGIDWTAMSKDGLEIVQGIKPFVFARNCNLGIKAADRDDVILLNDDALLTVKQGFSLLQKAAAEHQEYGCIGSTTNRTGQLLQRRNKIGLRHVHHIAFMCVLIPRRTIEKIGLLDERYCLDYGVEDRDYCEMINRVGLKVGVHDGCFVDHSRLLSSFRGRPSAPGCSKKNRALFLQKYNLPNYFNFR